ncbi:MAG: hypothetical protein ACYC2H_02230 [Thermoplasmatota archaeon]
MPRWVPFSAVALALLAAGPMFDVLAQPVLMVAPPAGRLLPGGTIEVDVSLDHALWNTTSPCVDVRIELDVEQTSHEHGTWQWVCPHAVAHPVLLAPHAKGILAIEWNGTVERIPFLVPRGAHASTWATLDADGLHVGRSNGPLQDWGRAGGGSAWFGLVQVIAFLGFLSICTLRGRLAWMAGLLAVISLAWIPLAAQEFPHLPGWIILMSWAVLLAAAFTRIPDDKPPGGAPHGEPLDEQPAP